MITNSVRRPILLSPILKYYKYSKNSLNGFCVEKNVAVVQYAYIKRRVLSMASCTTVKMKDQGKFQR